MIIQSPDDLFKLYPDSLNKELEIKITQFYNADNGSLLEINSLLMAVMRGCALEVKLNAKSFLARLGNFRVIYQKAENGIVFKEIERA